METLRSGINDLISSLNAVRNNSNDPQEQQLLQNIVRILFKIWEESIGQTLDKNNSAYAAALKSLDEAKKTANEAVADCKKVAEAIKIATQATNAISSAIGTLGPMLL
jgi:hypothetical protein